MLWVPRLICLICVFKYGNFAVTRQLGHMSKKIKDQGLRTTDPRLEWTLGAELGNGTFGVVYFATHSPTGAIAAAKVCAATNDDELADLVQEAKILLECDHHHVLKAMSAYILKDTIYMFLEACMGGALDSIAEAIDGFDEPTIRVAMYQCTLALVYIHERAIIHRDIKAGNIMLTEKGSCKLADFGVSARMDKPEGRRNTLIGTPYWMAPEVIQCDFDGRNPYGANVDVYSLGITAIELAQVVPPNDDLAPSQVLLHRLRYESPFFSSPDRWSPLFQNFVHVTVTKDPNRRPTSQQCLKHPFLQGDEVKRIDLLIELFKIVTASAQEYEEVDITDEGETNEEPVEILEKSETTMREESRNELRTIRRTIRYEFNGVSKEVTVVKTVDDTNMDQRERDRAVRDKIVNQLKILRIQEHRDLKKQVVAQQQMLTDIIIRQKAEYEGAISKYNTEAENLGKLVAKELEKKRSLCKFEVEKLFKKIKSSIEKEKKLQVTARKPKNKGKFDQCYMDDSYLPKLCEKGSCSISQLEAILHEQLTDAYRELIATKQQKLMEQLKSVMVIRFNQVLEVSQIQKNHICSKFELMLQHKVKYHQKELSQTAKYLVERMDEKLRDQARERRALPKLQRDKLKKEIDSLKRALRKQKAKNVKEQLQSRQNELSKQLEEELENFKTKQEEEIARLEERQSQEIKEVKDYQDEKFRSIHQYYQEQLYLQYLDDEDRFKNEILSMYHLKFNRDNEYEKELAEAQSVMINFQCNLESLTV